MLHKNVVSRKVASARRLPTSRWRDFRLSLILASLVIAASHGAKASTYEVIHNFTGFSGSNPQAGVVMDRFGSLYGTTYAGGPANDGMVFELTPPAVGQTGWTQTVLHQFTGGEDGGEPQTNLILSTAGELYGTVGGGFGIAFEMTPPPPGQKVWSKTVLHVFQAANGWEPWGNLIMDESGTLYGTTVMGGSAACQYECGVIFKLTPPGKGQTTWTETVLHDFLGGRYGYTPLAGLVMDKSGALYGTTYYGGVEGTCNGGCGIVFKLTPPAPGKTSWIETVLHEFSGGDDGANPQTGVILDGSGAIYGTAGGGRRTSPFGCACGVVFKLEPPSGSQTRWSEKVLYQFTGSADGNGPDAALVMDNSGALYGTTAYGGDFTWCPHNGCGVVYKLTPSGSGASVWTKSSAYVFTGRADGGYPEGGLIIDKAGALYGTTMIGGNLDYCGHAGCGVVFKLTP